MGLSLAEFNLHCFQHPEDQMCFQDFPIHLLRVRQRLQWVIWAALLPVQ